jgi:hypothetical protein
MTDMNRSGLVAITIYHSLHKEVLALAQFAWRCKDCGRVYRRQRKTIQPRRHLCGTCRGALQELPMVHRGAVAAPLAPSITSPPSAPLPSEAGQLSLGWGASIRALFSGR